MDQIKRLYTELAKEMSPVIHNVIAERAKHLSSRVV